MFLGLSAFRSLFSSCWSIDLAFGFTSGFAGGRWSPTFGFLVRIMFDGDIASVWVTTMIG
jgi:hypothetical protein